MKKLLILITICLSSQIIQAQHSNHSSQEVYQDSTLGFSFEINYWFNLHHFLWLESFMEVNLDSTIINRKLPGNSQESLDQALEYYKSNLVDLNLRSSDYMSEFKSWITNEGKELRSVPKKFQPHVGILKEVSDVYNEFFWPVHKKVCEKVLNDNIDLIRKTEEQFHDGITKLTRQFWQREKIKLILSIPVRRQAGIRTNERIPLFSLLMW